MKFSNEMKKLKERSETHHPLAHLDRPPLGVALVRNLVLVHWHRRRRCPFGRGRRRRRGRGRRRRGLFSPSSLEQLRPEALPSAVQLLLQSFGVLTRQLG